MLSMEGNATYHVISPSTRHQRHLHIALTAQNGFSGDGEGQFTLQVVVLPNMF